MHLNLMSDFKSNDNLENYVIHPMSNSNDSPQSYPVRLLCGIELRR